jgi:hypothetical protein
MLTGTARLMTMYGGTITDISAPVHDNAAGPGDDFATLTVTFDVPDTTQDTNVMLLFGGHLAAALGANGWGSGLGASSISGGPYHARVVGMDGESVGRRDNQIQGAVMYSPAIATTPVPSSGTVGATIHDTAQLSGGSPSPSGNVTFTLYPPSDADCSGSPVFTSVGSVSNGQAQSGNYTTSAVGVYHWVAEYSGGQADAPAVHSCGEPVTTSKAAPRIATTPVPSSATAGAALHDTAVLTDGFSPTGTVTFELYPPSDPTCAGTPVYTDTDAVSSATAASDNYTATVAGTYQWIARYAGDALNESADGACGDEPVVVAAAGGIGDGGNGDGGNGDGGDGGIGDGGNGDGGNGDGGNGDGGNGDGGNGDGGDGGNLGGDTGNGGDNNDGGADVGTNGSSGSVRNVVLARHQTRTLAHTGSDVLPLGATGLSMLGLGVLMIRLPRRRTGEDAE